MRKGQAAVMDALILMMICSASATLLIYVSGIYGASTNQQILSIYDYEYMNIALLSLRYVNDAHSDNFWTTLKVKLDDTSSVDPLKDQVGDYFNGDARIIFDKMESSAPGVMILYFTSDSSSEKISCYHVTSPDSIVCNSIDPDTLIGEGNYASEYVTAASIKSSDGLYWEIAIRLYF